MPRIVSFCPATTAELAKRRRITKKGPAESDAPMEPRGKAKAKRCPELPPDTVDDEVADPQGAINLKVVKKPSRKVAPVAGEVAGAHGAVAAVMKKPACAVRRPQGSARSSTAAADDGPVAEGASRAVVPGKFARSSMRPALPPDSPEPVMKRQKQARPAHLAPDALGCSKCRWIACGCGACRVSDGKGGFKRR